jgi:hypothetical protein
LPALIIVPATCAGSPRNQAIGENTSAQSLARNAQDAPVRKVFPDAGDEPVVVDLVEQLRQIQIYDLGACPTWARHSAPAGFAGRKDKTVLRMWALPALSA